MHREPDLERAVRLLREAGCVFAEDEAALLLAHVADAPAGAPDAESLEKLLARRCAGEPLEHLLGWAEFAGRRLLVASEVFVPRRRTELLVRIAAARCPTAATVVDLCCGSGALGVTLVHSADVRELHAADLTPAAVAVARSNLAALPIDAQVHTGDLFDALPRRLHGKIDVVLANTPYVPTAAIATLPPEAREHEPRDALDGGSDGLDVQRRVAAAAPGWLAPGGFVIVEVAAAQSQSSAELFAAVGLHPEVVSDDDLGATVVLARRIVG